MSAAPAPGQPSRRAAGPRRAMESVDWMQVQARIEDAMRALAAENSMEPEEVRRILRERARALARPVSGVDEQPMREHLEVGVGDDRLLLESRYVVEVLRRVEPTPLPGARPPVAALVAWRGRILTALDLRLVVGAGAAEGERTTRLVVLGEDRPELGLLVERVGELASLPLATIGPVPGGARQDYALGITDDARPVIDVMALLRRHADG